MLLGLSWPWSYRSWIYNYICNLCLSPLMLWVRISIKARYTLCDKVWQWLATGRWFSTGPSVSSTNKTDRHEITEILLKVTLNTIKQNNQTNMLLCLIYCVLISYSIVLIDIRSVSHGNETVNFLTRCSSIKVMNSSCQEVIVLDYFSS